MPSLSRQPLTHLDLFSGIGGFTLAAHYLGDIETKQFVEIDPDAQQVLKWHFPSIPIHSDIRSFHAQGKQFDLITMGFPCTGTSSAGKRTGLSHSASALWRQGARIIIECQPKFIIVEQPAGFVRRGLRSLLGFLRMAGYYSEVESIAAQECGAYNRRERIFVVSYPNEWKNRIRSSWSNQVGSMVETARSYSTWLPIERDRDGTYHGLPKGMVVASGTPGRARARYLAGRAVTPPQAMIPLQRVLKINQEYNNKKT